ncbi:hypothetical protein DFJ58DRAFT_717854 [Suillus subalutaceus]|uniref:uncharacterized protein n=1 Tax=Suillus subalutaceus TaxID=48586 RepID=UPI001B87330E|nr:uncharacterized protein DFJ58DRAFT_717854 [Suillus subalutaceus]KAG1843160.1 hypothetical protein DFJ58DRAFT_717854 [Suillus subalutaceus]
MRVSTVLWTTPHSFDHQHELEQLFPESDILKMFFILTHFTQYCDKLHIPEMQHMPASATLLSTFIAASAGSISDSTMSNWLAGLHFWHISDGTQCHGIDSPLLHHMKCGLTCLVPPNSKQAQCPPVTLDALIQLGQGLDLSNSFDVTVFTIACVAFWSCCRLGELLIPSPNTFDAIKHISHSILPITTHHFHNITPHVPLVALLLHLDVNMNIPSHAPLFSFKTADGAWSPMTKPWFMDRINTIWSAAGHPVMPGHAFRCAMELLLEGVHPDVVATQGHWKSRAFLDYWCQIESILPLFISYCFRHSTRIQAMLQEWFGLVFSSSSLRSPPSHTSRLNHNRL